MSEAELLDYVECIFPQRQLTVKVGEKDHGW